MINCIRIFLVLIFIIYSGCTDKDNNGDDGGGIGPCVHTYKEPILIITGVNDTVSNKLITSLKLSNLKINGLPQSGTFPIITSFGIISKDSLYYCNSTFGIGHDEGTYEFTLAAEGYPPKQFKIENVKYSIHKGGCPSYDDGGTRVSLVIN